MPEKPRHLSSAWKQEGKTYRKKAVVQSAMDDAMYKPDALFFMRFIPSVLNVGEQGEKTSTI